MNVYLRDLHHLPLADLARIGASCGPLLRALPDNALIALAAALAREVWAGDDPLATAEDRAFSLVSGTVLPRRGDRVFFCELPLSRFPAAGLRLIGNDPRDSLIERRVARHALNCRSLFGTLLAEACRRRLLPTQENLQVAWDAALTRGNVAPDADRGLLLAEAWAGCTLEPGDRGEAETAASAWLERLQATIRELSTIRASYEGGISFSSGGQTYTVPVTDTMNAADIARAINESGVPATAEVEGDRIRIRLSVHEDLHRGSIVLHAASRRAEAREPAAAPLHRPVGPSLSRRLGRRDRRS